MQTPDILIIGGGVIGCSLARELARANQQVVVLDRGRAGGGASSAAAGLLSPTFALGVPDALVDLAFDSASLYESWIAELRDDGGGDVGFRRHGMLDVLLTAEQASQSHERCRHESRPGRRVEFLSAQQLQQREPGIAASTHGAVFYPDDAQVEPIALSRAVARVAELAGVVIRENESIQRLVRDGDRLIEVHTPSACYRPGTVVLAAGAWSAVLAETLGLHLPIVPVKGQMLLADCRVSPVRTPMFAGDALFVPRPDGSLVLGVTLEHAGFDERVTLDGVHKILADTCAVVPEVGRLTLARAWAGLRPGTADNWPCMGPLPPLRNLWVSAGHFRKGILLTPICARLMAQSILANHPVDELAPFKPTRRTP